MTEHLVEPDPAAAELAAARAGDAAAFDRLVAPLRRELHAHGYRMLGSAHDADDAVQDGLLRAWRGLAGFRGEPAALRSWLYTVITRVCLDSIKARGRRALPYDLGPASDRVHLDPPGRTDLAWLGPYPSAAAPADRFERRESLELAYVAACQRLPGNQRAALVLFDVVGFDVAEIAMIMDTSTTAVNSALARARRALAAADPGEPCEGPDDERLRAAATGFANALEHGDLDGLVALLAADVTWSMPPVSVWYQGIERVAEFAARVPLACGTWRCRIVEANGRPAVAGYLRLHGDTVHRAWSLTLFEVRSGRITAITSFLGEDHFARFGLPDTH
ncbi:RNA polymerase subunit sigma-70 [Microlunatus parietis]|uniref:RNA polymerase sigma-70 factor (ECF subfamily) n=1 Tax=Microlunatus parietis TaxID=682979 RepID=A0A7Y9LDN1_9ACTN|nr:RNA polymerase subunit sigma-70 [Microlunatus parietis]NYE72975.1 RNA polymerase sigma-70 factor (ECF subfamily) [Microlunatus parietis]